MAWGMEVGVSLSPLEFPREFAKAVPGLVPARGLKSLDVAPGPSLGPSDEQLMALVKTRIRAYLETYPDLDELYLTLPEFPEWAAHAEAAWSELVPDAKAGELSRLLEGGSRPSADCQR